MQAVPLATSRKLGASPGAHTFISLRSTLGAFTAFPTLRGTRPHTTACSRAIFNTRSQLADKVEQLRHAIEALVNVSETTVRAWDEA